MQTTTYQKMHAALLACIIKQKNILDELPPTTEGASKEAYYQMFNVVTDMIRDFQTAQRRSEAIFMDESDEADEKSPILDNCFN